MGIAPPRGGINEKIWIYPDGFQALVVRGGTVLCRWIWSLSSNTWGGGGMTVDDVETVFSFYWSYSQLEVNTTRYRYVLSKHDTLMGCFTILSWDTPTALRMDKRTVFMKDLYTPSHALAQHPWFVTYNSLLWWPRTLPIILEEIHAVVFKFITSSWLHSTKLGLLDGPVSFMMTFAMAKRCLELKSICS